MKSRIFFIMQYVHHPETHAPLLNEDTIKNALFHRSINRYAYVLHDKDRWTPTDESDNPKHKAGEVKPSHWHIAIELKTNQTEISTIAKWFQIPDNFVEVKKGAGAFMDCVAYLTHETPQAVAEGKFNYSDEEVKSNFNFREELNKRAARVLKYGSSVRDISERDALRLQVLNGELTLREVRMNHPLEYANDLSVLTKLRNDYLTKMAPLPESRMNIYVEGPGGNGKGLLTKALAQALTNRTLSKSDPEVYFEVGGSNVAFDGYDGQDVIIWNDCTPLSLIAKFGDRNAVFDALDTHPTTSVQNIKYGSTRLINRINILNNTMPFAEFISSLAGEYRDRYGQFHQADKDKGQAYRRFPIFMVMKEEELQLYFNLGVFNGSMEYAQYQNECSIRANMQKIASRCGNNKELRNMITGAVFSPATALYDKMLPKLEGAKDPNRQEVINSILKEGYGEIPDSRNGQTIDFSKPQALPSPRPISQEKLLELFATLDDPELTIPDR